MHKSKSVYFTLTVYDFFIKYTDTKDELHLLGALKSQYTLSEDWEAKVYYEVTLKWD